MTPMRTLFSMLAAASLVALVMFAQEPPAGGAPKGKGKGGPPKNLKVLTPETYRPLMDVFTASLGVQCTFCHVMGNMPADDKPEKEMARMMITMTREINSKFTDGKQHVTCYTCHRGAEMPLTEAAKQ